MANLRTGLVILAASVGVFGACAAEPAISVPPHEHPRLYLRAAQAAELEARLRDPVLQPAVQKLKRAAERPGQAKIEWDALRYLITKDRQAGRATVEAALAFLKKSKLPDRQDACRVTGRAMVTGSIVYDWLYDLLTPEERQAFIAELVRLAKTLECGYPPARQGSVTGHSSEAMIMRDLLSAGIAVYDEFPDMYNLAARRFFREHLPARNWLYNGHAYHQGDSYGVHRFSWDLFPLWIFDRMGAGNVYNPEQRWVPYLWIYTTRPDGQRLRAGDTFAHSAPRGQPWSDYGASLFTASYYSDGFLLDQHLRQNSGSGNEAIFEVLWRDTALTPKPVASLPLSRYFGPPFGWTVARTGWGEDAVIAEMKVNEVNFNNHQHADAGAFQLYYKGALAIDSGLYSGSSGQYGSPHCRNYYWRTVAHNSLLVYDPQEVFGRKGDSSNDGGQRLPNGRSEPRTLEDLLDSAKGYRTGKVIAHGFGPEPQAPDYTLLQGDITAAYSEKVKQVVRSFAFLNLRNRQVPAALVVFDRVVSADPSFRKYWLLHTQEEPVLGDGAATVACTRPNEGGQLNLKVLLPEADGLQLDKVGGPGKEFWVFGKNYANDVDPSALKRGSMETGAWRVEIAPKQPAAESLFLTVMQVADVANGALWPVRRVEADGRVGCLLEGPETHWLVLFRKDAARSGEPVRLTVPGKVPCCVLVTDLKPGRWTARNQGAGQPLALQVDEASGAGWFDAQPGVWTLQEER
jgi:heparin/heparan-sulfate lyase